MASYILIQSSRGRSSSLWPRQWCRGEARQYRIPVAFRTARTAAFVALLLGLTAFAWHQPLSAESTPRIVAIGDIHGARVEFASILQHLGLIDDQHRWSGGSTILVQTGDITDRGAEVRGVLDLLMTLERQADADGGKVVVLLGNHETMNLMGVVRDVGPWAYTSFADEESEERREKAYQAYVKLHAGRAKALGREPPNVQTQEEWMAAHPLGFVEYLEALGPQGRYGRWLRSKSVVTRVGDAIFLHGGIHPEAAPATLQEINEEAKREIRNFDEFRSHLVSRKVILPFFTFNETLVAARLELDAWIERLWPGPPAPDRKPVVLESRDREHFNILVDLLSVGTWSIVNPDGPVWFRGFARWSPEEGQAHVIALLDQYSASHFVVGHTIPSTMRVTPRFGARVFLIDTGMLSSHYRGGRASALEIEDDRITVVSLGERIPLVDRTSVPSR